MKNEIVLLGRIPSKKNSVIAMVRGGRVIHIPSNQYREWHKSASEQLMHQRLQGKIPFKEPKLGITIYAPDKRKSDLTNKVESIMDLFVDNGIIIDDNWFECGEINIKLGGVDTSNPRAVILISSTKQHE